MAQNNGSRDARRGLPTEATRGLDPLAAVLKLGARRVRTGLLVGLAGGLLVHGAAAGHGRAVSDLFQVQTFASMVRASIRSQIRLTFEIEREPEPEKEPEPPPEPPPEPEPKEDELPPIPEEAPKDPNPPPPAAAEAAKVLATEADPTSPLDLTGFTIVTGNAERAPGGLTAASGTSKRPVFDRAARSDGEGRAKTADTTKPVAAAPKINLSRPANVVGRTDWSCPWPPEADVDQTNYRRVELLITVGPDGRAEQVAVLKNGDKGFGAKAQGCAMRKRFAPALDAAGKPITSTLRVNMTFQR